MITLGNMLKNYTTSEDGNYDSRAYSNTDDGSNNENDNSGSSYNIGRKWNNRGVLLQTFTVC